MRFEARELKPYAEPVSADDLKEGEIFFFLDFIDRDLLIPEFTAVVFIGRNIVNDGSDKVFFQDAESYLAGVRHDSPKAEANATFYSGAQDDTSHIFDYERALDCLLACSIRRREKLGGSKK
jgi:hypothetical protein